MLDQVDHDVNGVIVAVTVGVVWAFVRTDHSNIWTDVGLTGRARSASHSPRRGRGRASASTGRGPKRGLMRVGSLRTIASLPLEAIVFFPP